MKEPSAHMLAAALVLAEHGVAYSPRYGALCPLCGARMKVTVTKKWHGASRVRWHRCRAEGCLLARVEKAVKSVEMDETERMAG